MYSLYKSDLDCWILLTYLMKTKGVDVFVPNGEWKGLTGLEGLYPDGYLELNWKENEIRDL